MHIDEIMRLITSEYSWEQVLERIVALEGLDPWDLDVKALSDAFLRYLSKLQQLDFRIPAKYIIIAAVLLKMKTQNIGLSFLTEEPDESEIEFDFEADEPNGKEIPSIEPPIRRMPRRKIMLDELVQALRKVLQGHEKKIEKKKARDRRIEISEDEILKRIDGLYNEIMLLLKELKNIKFSQLVKEWRKKEIIRTFLPLIYLHHNRKIKCHQEKPFDEIIISGYEQT